MDHAQAQDTFSDYVDGSLPERQRAEVDQHLATCIQCRTELTAFRNTVTSLGSLRQSAPPNFLGDIKQQIYKRSRGRFFRPRWKLFGDPVRVGVARDHHRDARLLHRHDARVAERRSPHALTAVRFSTVSGRHAHCSTRRLT